MSPLRLGCPLCEKRASHGATTNRKAHGKRVSPPPKLSRQAGGEFLGNLPFQGFFFEESL